MTPRCWPLAVQATPASAPTSAASATARLWSWGSQLHLQRHERLLVVAEAGAGRIRRVDVAGVELRGLPQ